MKEYMFLIRGGDYHQGSPDEMQQRMQKYQGWMQKMMEEGRYKAGQPLEEGEGRMLVNNSDVLTDGPFMEAKEIIGGFIILFANDFDEATELAKGCPLAEHCNLEIRKLMEIPPQ